MAYNDHKSMHASAWLTALLLVASSPLQGFSEYKVVDHPIEVGGAVEDADISPNGDYVAAAVRKCETSDGSPTCRLDIEVWSSAGSKRLAQRTLLTDVREFAVAVRVSADGHTLVISDGQGKLHMWRTSDPTESSSIDLGLTNGDVRDLLEKQKQEYERRFGSQPKLGALPRLAQIETSVSSPLVGAVIRVGSAEMIRVYDLTSGKPLQSWSFMDAASYKGAPALSWSQDGRHLAISLPGTRGLKHPERTDPATLLIYDVTLGQLSAKFEAREEWERSLAAPGRVVFAGDKLIVSTHRMPGSLFRPTLRVLDSNTGETTRKISAEESGVRDPIAISGDSKVLLGFVGRVRKEMLWSDLTSMSVPIDTRIGLWEMPAGRLIFSSETLPLIPERASFRLNKNGSWIVGFDQGTKLILLQLQQIGATR